MHKHRKDAGFSLAALIFFATAASILLAAAVPAYQMQAKREMEAELIFRGGEYTRAILKYQKKFGVYPTSIDQLVSTNSLRFVRRAYKDPVTGKDFRLILINPDGSLTGSKVFTQNVNTQPLFGNTQPAGSGQNNPQQQNNNNNQPNTGRPNNTPGSNNNSSGFNSSFNSSFGSQQGQTPNGNTAPSNGFQNNTSGFNSSFGNQSNGNQQNQRNQPNNQPRAPGSPTNGSLFNGATNINGGSSNPVTGGGIIGVASDSEKDSIMVYNNRQKYDEWEFIAILNQQGQRGQPPNGQNQPPNQGGQPPNSPFGNTPTSPFGGLPQNPLGGGGQQPPPNNGLGNGRQPPTNPFGFGGNPSTPGQPGKLP